MYSNAPTSDTRTPSPDRRALQGKLKPRKKQEKGERGMESYFEDKDPVRKLEMERRDGDELFSYDGFQLPGTFREEQGEDCGQLMMFQCTDCGSRKNVHRKCLRPVCPHCWKSAIDRMTKRIVRGKLLPFMEQRRMTPNVLTHPTHLVVSFPEEDWGKSVKKLRKKAAELAKEAGMTDGIAFFHPWRAKKIGEGQAAWFDGPHVHFISFGWIDPEKTKEIHDRTGVIVENIRDEKSGKYLLKNERSLYRVVWYNLSHAATKKNRSAYQFYGAIQKFKGEPIDDGNECLACGAPMEYIPEEQVRLEEWQEFEEWARPPCAGFWIPMDGEFMLVQGEGDLKALAGVEIGTVDRSKLYASGIKPVY